MPPAQRKRRQHPRGQALAPSRCLAHQGPHRALAHELPMTTSIFPILSTLSDVDGVQGAFVISDDGSLVDLDMPAMFEPSLFGEIGPRIVRLKETFASGGDEMDACAIRYSDFKLYVRS